MNALQKIQSAGFDLSLNQRGNIFISPASKLTEKQRQYVSTLSFRENKKNIKTT